MAFCGNCGAYVDKGKFCPKCGTQISYSAGTDGNGHKNHKPLKMLAGLIVAVIVAVMVLKPHTVDEPCDWCGHRPSMAYEVSDGSKAYVCKDCSKECLLCNKKATKHYEAMMGMVVFVCNDCYKEIVSTGGF